MMTFFMIASLLLLPYATAFMGQNVRVNQRITCVRSSETNAEHETTPMMIDSKISSKFKILTCSSTSCAKKRETCGLDSFATYGAFYNRIKGAFPDVALEESPCLGSCKQAPCVAIEHEDFVGTVALEGMSANEFSDRVFHSVITEEDADRVWGCVENAIHQMAEEEEDDELDDEYI